MDNVLVNMKVVWKSNNLLGNFSNEELNKKWNDYWDNFSQVDHPCCFAYGMDILGAKFLFGIYGSISINVSDTNGLLHFKNKERKNDVIRLLRELFDSLSNALGVKYEMLLDEVTLKEN